MDRKWKQTHTWIERTNQWKIGRYSEPKITKTLEHVRTVCFGTNMCMPSTYGQNLCVYIYILYLIGNTYASMQPYPHTSVSISKTILIHASPMHHPCIIHPSFLPSMHAYIHAYIQTWIRAHMHATIQSLTYILAYLHAFASSDTCMHAFTCKFIIWNGQFNTCYISATWHVQVPLFWHSDFEFNDSICGLGGPQAWQQFHGGLKTDTTEKKTCQRSAALGGKNLGSNSKVRAAATSDPEPCKATVAKGIDSHFGFTVGFTFWIHILDCNDSGS